MSTLGDLSGQPAPRSVWRRALMARTGGRPVDAWLIRQANLRGFHGAYVVDEDAPIDAALTLEDIVVALCAPQAPAEGRTFKLVLRIVQSGRLDLRHLRWLARKEKAERILHWLMSQVPESERTPPVAALLEALGGEPRGARPVRYRYDPTRLIRRPFRRTPGERWTPRG
jgi:hypothetical protein